MEFTFEVWHWFVLGMLLIALEMFIPTFTALWFGVAALVVGILLWFMPEWSPAAQMLTWGILSIVSALLWFKYLKPLSIDRTKAGLSREAVLGQVGFITVVPQQSQVGTVRFSLPVLGADEWLCRSEEPLELGERVRVIEILGNELVVKKHST
ncbi:MAG: NfeD family protein [Pseudomonadota bacterium]|nr:NfeD family protein [Pseudomonadota bacterium]